jgi:hypothetical protein
MTISLSYFKKYGFFIIYFIFFLVPKIELVRGIYIWPFELFLLVLILWYLEKRGRLLFQKELILPFIFFLYTGILMLIFSLLFYEFQVGDFFRMVKMLLYSLSLPILYRIIREKFDSEPLEKPFYEINKIFLYTSFILMVLMLSQIAYNIIENGLPPISDFIWLRDSNLRPYLYTGRYITSSGLEDIPTAGGNHNATGVLSILVIFLGYFQYKKERNKFFLICSLIGIVTLLMSFSRSSIVVLVLISLYYFFQLRLRSQLKVLIIVLLIFVPMVLINLEFLLNYTVLSKFTMMKSGVDGSTQGRLDIWAELLDLRYYKYFFLLTGSGFGFTTSISFILGEKYVVAESGLLMLIMWGGAFSILYLYFYYKILANIKYLRGINRNVYLFFYSFFLAFILPNIFTGGDILMDATMHFLNLYIALIFFIKTKVVNEYITYNGKS